MLSPQIMKLMISFVEENGIAAALGLDPEQETWKGYFYAGKCQQPSDFVASFKLIFFGKICTKIPK